MWHGSVFQVVVDFVIIAMCAAESTFAGDRDVNYVNCLVPCDLECRQPGVDFASLSKLTPVSKVMRTSGYHGNAFDLLPLGKEPYMKKLVEAYEATLTRARSAALLEELRPSSSPRAVQTHQLPFVHRLMFWDCEENCRYECMIENREKRFVNGEQQVHYHGKWPFTRVLGVQELFSSMFSAFNGLPHLLLLWRLVCSPSLAQTRGSGVWKLQMVVNINTWLQSTLFHARERPTTEALDYHCTSLNLAFTLGCALFHHMPSRWPVASSLRAAFILPTVAWATLVFHLTFVSFDYGFFRTCSIIMGVCGSISWLVWFCRFRRERPYAWKIILASWGVYFMLPFELLDFPPLFGLLDAHATWHFLTIPLQQVLCSFVLDNLKHDAAAKVM